MIILFGDPNDYLSKIGNWSAYPQNSLVYFKFLISRFHDDYRTVAIDSQSSRIYYSNNAMGTVAFSNYIVDNSYNYSYFIVPPITKVVNLTVFSLH